MSEVFVLAFDICGHIIVQRLLGTAGVTSLPGPLVREDEVDLGMRRGVSDQLARTMY